MTETAPMPRGWQAELRVEFPRGETPDEDVACAWSGRYATLVAAAPVSHASRAVLVGGFGSIAAAAVAVAGRP